MKCSLGRATMSRLGDQSDFRLIEEKIGNDEKGPDNKLWSKNPQLGDVGRTSGTFLSASC